MDTSSTTEVPNVVDPRAPAPDEPHDFSLSPRRTTYETFLDTQKVYGVHLFFKPENPSDVAGYQWLRAWRQAAVAPILIQAFERGRRVRIQIGLPHTTPPDGARTATVTSAELVYRPIQLAMTLGDLPEAEDDLHYEVTRRAPRTHFAAKSTLRRQNGQLIGAWRNTFDLACEGAPRLTSIQEQAILEGPYEFGNCHGKTIVLCTHF